MALQDSFTTQSGLTIEEAYLRVDDTAIAVTHDKMTFAVSAFSSAAARAAGSPPLEAPRFYTAPYDLEAPNPFAQAYAWLTSEGPYPEALAV